MMDNLYAFLQQYRSTDIHFLGRTLRAEPDHALYYSGGAGNILRSVIVENCIVAVRPHSRLSFSPSPPPASCLLSPPRQMIVGRR